MISIQKEERILRLLRQGKKSLGWIAARAGVGLSTVTAVRDNRISRAAARAALAQQEFIATGKRTKLGERTARRCPTCRARIKVLPCVYCNAMALPSDSIQEKLQ